MKSVGIAVVARALCILPLIPRDVSAQFNIDHFKVYDAKDIAIPEGRRVELQGQFDDALKPSVLVALTHFANPVSKNGAAILDKDAHFTWYKLKPELEK